MSEFELNRRMCDNGWPDIGHYEYCLVKVTNRTSFWQNILGPKKEDVLWYGEDKPSDEDVQKDIKKYNNERKN